MRIRSFILLTVLALVLAACGGAGGEDTTTTSTEAIETTTTAPAVESVQLSYTLEPGTSHQYEVDMNQTIDLSTSGETGALGEEDDLPGNMSLLITGTTLFTYAVAEGPEDGTFEVTITGDFTDLEFSGTIDGEPVDPSEIPELAELEPVDTTIVVDDQGNVIPEDSSTEDVFGGLGGLGMLEGFGAATPGQFVGPSLSEDEVSVGDTWTETVETPMMPEQDPVVTDVESEVVSTDTVDGSEVFVIDTNSTTSAFEFDLAELLIGFMTAFVPDDASEEERAELDAMVEQIRFAFAVDETTSNMTTWFDPAEGVSRRSEFNSETHMVMDVNIPDEATGELVGFAMDMTVGQDVTYRLTD